MSEQKNLPAATSNNVSRHTALYDLHLEFGGKMVEFAGWHMPVQFPAGIMAEHKQCRESAALFDVSHMGQLELRGENVARQLEKLVPADILNLPAGKARYSFFTNAQGGILDDLIITNAGDHFYVVVNASMRDQDLQHLRNHLQDIEMNELDEYSLIALQGPRAIDVIEPLCPAAANLSFMESVQAPLMGVNCRLSRLGYTGEDGFEISIPNSQAARISSALLNHELCEPAGLGARDSLRLEAGLCLYGNDIDQQTTPIEASLLWAIPKRRREDGGFPGDSVIQQQISQGAPRKLVGIKPEGRVPAREGAQVLDEPGNTIGEVTSGCFGPTTAGPVALAYVTAEHSAIGTEVSLSIRGKSYPASVVKTPFVQQRYKR